MEALTDNYNFLSVCEFLPNHLYFVTVQNINNGGSCEAIIPHTDELHFFSTDNELIYHNFYGDFGPLSITCLYKFCKKLINKLATYAGDAFYEKFTSSRFGRKDVAEKLHLKFVKKKVVVYYTSTNNEKRANAAFLISAFAVLYLGYSPRLALKALQPNKMRYRAFQDASVGLSPYKITMKDCLDALHKASAFGFFNFNDFNASECSYYENIEHGDLNWIVPRKFIAFPGPVEEKNDYYHHPNFYIEYFLCNNVTDVVRLNQRAYDAKCFTMFNLKHHDLYMQDGTDPPDSILKNFMSIAESASGAIAVHCKAGLGRTGSLIGAYLLKHYRMTAKEAIAWIRICRPGSVIGHQQTWLENHEEQLWYEGNEWRFKMYGKTEIVPFLQYGIYSFEAPKKEFPGLRELLANLTKRARYRFIVKNRPKKSKTRLQQMIRSLLENGKSTTETKNKSEVAEIPTVSQKSSVFSQGSQGNASTGAAVPPDPSKNVQYLKAPPKGNENIKQQPSNYEYHPYPYPYPYPYPQPQPQPQPSHQLQPQPQPQPPQQLQSQPQPLEYRKPVPIKDLYCNEFQKSYEKPTSNPYNPNYTGYNVCDGQLQAMYSNPNSFYPNISESEFSNYAFDKKSLGMSSSVQRTLRNPEMPKVYSEQMPMDRYDKIKTSNIMSKSVDKNWKQNNLPTGLRSYHSGTLGDKMQHKYAEQQKYQPNEEVCAFDSRVGTISQYSRFNRRYLNKGYLDHDNDYYSEKKINSYDYNMPPGRSPHGFLLSPEDLQSWVETFDEKPNDTLTDKPFAVKRSSNT